MARIVLKNEQRSQLTTKKETCNGPCIRLAFRTTLLILFYFALSIGLTFYQRKFLQEFHFPLSVVVCHLIFKFVIASACRTIWKCCTKQQRVILDWGNYVKKVAPTGIASGLDVGLSNWGLELINVSLYTMTKSTVIIFILGFALLFKLEEKSWSLFLIVVMISGGLFLFTYKATEFDFLGFILVLTASFTSGLRWTLAQLVMQKSKLGLENPVDMVYHVQPWMIVSIIPFAIGFEGLALAGTCKLFRFHETSVLAVTLLQIVSGAMLAFCMEVAEYMVVTNTSSLTLSVACIFKEVCTLILAVEAGDRMNFINVVGLLCCLGGIACHVVHKAVVAGRRSNMDDSLNSKLADSSSDLRVPLLGDSSVMFMAGSINSTDESDEDTSNVLFDIMQRRDNPR
ncbi:solute carrier family 35 member C2 [Periplaneta americana]|uniref:solute carrier family 35 member C2 n=1 Tax=Periplaneta americana TaxID=6978 RepID=UPI0037E822FD